MCIRDRILLLVFFSFQGFSTYPEENNLQKSVVVWVLIFYLRQFHHLDIKLLKEFQMQLFLQMHRNNNQYWKHKSQNFLSHQLSIILICHMYLLCILKQEHHGVPQLHVLKESILICSYLYHPYNFQFCLQNLQNMIRPVVEVPMAIHLLTIVSYFDLPTIPN